jgi:hypothetical protein
VPTRSALRAAYVELAKRCHPDRFASASADLRTLAEARMKEVNAAHERLKPIARPDEQFDVHNDEPVASPPVQQLARSSGAIPSVVASAIAAVGVCAFFRLVGLQPATSSFARVAAQRTGTVTTTNGVSTTVARPTPRRQDTAANELEPRLAAIPASAAQQTRTLPRPCTLREMPSAGGRSLGIVGARTQFDVLEDSDGWVHVRGAGATGRTGWLGPGCWR